MTRDEWKTALAEMAGHWPRFPAGRIEEAVGYNLLQGEELPAVLGAIRVLSMNPEQKFPPNAGQILARIQQETAPAAWDEVLDEIRRMLKTLNRDRRCSSGPIGVIWQTPEVEEWSDPAIAELVSRSGGIGAWMQKLTIGFPGTADDTTFIAQQRGIYTSLRTRSIEHGRVAALDAGTRAALVRGGAQPLSETIAAVLPKVAANG